MAKKLGNKKKRIIYRYECIGGCDKKRYSFSYEVAKGCICKKCQSLIPPEGQTGLFDALEKTESTSEDINKLVD